MILDNVICFPINTQKRFKTVCLEIIYSLVKTFRKLCLIFSKKHYDPTKILFFQKNDPNDARLGEIVLLDIE